MKVGFIGLGNMATAMIGGMIQKGIVAPSDIYGADKFEASVKKAADNFGIHAGTDNLTVVSQADVLFLAVKPQIYPVVIEEISKTKDSPTSRMFDNLYSVWNQRYFFMVSVAASMGREEVITSFTS